MVCVLIANVRFAASLYRCCWNVWCARVLLKIRGSVGCNRSEGLRRQRNELSSAARQTEASSKSRALPLARCSACQSGAWAVPKSYSCCRYIQQTLKLQQHPFPHGIVIRGFSMSLIGDGSSESDPVVACQISQLRTPRARATEPGLDPHLHRGVQAAPLRASQPRDLG